MEFTRDEMVGEAMNGVKKLGTIGKVDGAFCELLTSALNIRFKHGLNPLEFLATASLLRDFLCDKLITASKDYEEP